MKKYTIGDFIRCFRLDNGRTQSEFAKEIGTNTETVCRWECDKAKPSLKMIRKMSDRYNIPICDFTKFYKEEI